MTIQGPPGHGQALPSSVAALAHATAELHRQRWGIPLPLPPPTDEVRIEGPEGSGLELPTASIGRHHTWLRIHSARRPIEEATMQVAQALGERTAPVVCVIGAGLGYVLDVLLARGSRVLVLEPEPALIAWAIGLRDRREAIAEGRLLMLGGPQYEPRSGAWRLLTPVPESVPVVANRPICSARPAAAEAARAALLDILAGAASNEAAGRKFGRIMLLNTLANLSVCAREAPARALTGRLRSRPAVIAGAGPSLNRNIEELRPYRDGVVLLAVGNALKPLVAADLPPDLVAAVDPGEFTPGQFAGVEVSETYLVADPAVPPAVFDHYRGRTFVFRVGAHHPWPWLSARGVDPGVVRSWGSVITSCLHLVVQMGCDPLVFIGADMAYETGRTHADGSFAHGWVSQWITSGMSEEEAWSRLGVPAGIEEPGIGGLRLTSPSLLQFRNWIREESRALPVRIVNGTGAGILVGGRIEQRAVADVLAGTATTPPAAPAIAAAWDRARQSDRVAVLAAMQRLIGGRDFPAEWTSIASTEDLRETVSAWGR